MFLNAERARLSGRNPATRLRNTRGRGPPALPDRRMRAVRNRPFSPRPLRPVANLAIGMTAIVTAIRFLNALNQHWHHRDNVNGCFVPFTAHQLCELHHNFIESKCNTF